MSDIELSVYELTTISTAVEFTSLFSFDQASIKRKKETPRVNLKPEAFLND